MKGLTKSYQRHPLPFTSIRLSYGQSAYLRAPRSASRAHVEQDKVVFPPTNMVAN